jgi:hypothetical protein
MDTGEELLKDDGQRSDECLEDVRHLVDHERARWLRWLRLYATNRKVANPTPDEVIGLSLFT